jgi:hypothetical protein
MSKSKSQFQAFFDATGREQTPSATKEEAIGTKRQKGKHRHPDYTKMTAYIRSDTFIKLKTTLVVEKKEISELVEELVEQWLAQRV